MSKNTFRKIAAVTLVVCMVFAVCGFAFAQSRMITTTGTSFERNSNTKGTASLTATTSNVNNPHIESTMILQEAPLGSNNFVDSNVSPSVKTSYRASIMHTATFPLTTTKDYRVKIEIRDFVGSTTYLNIIYEDLQ